MHNFARTHASLDVYTHALKDARRVAVKGVDGMELPIRIFFPPQHSITAVFLDSWC